MSAIIPSGGNLTAGVKQIFLFSTPVKFARINMHPDAPAGVFGRWNAEDASETDFDFYLAPGDAEYGPPMVRIIRITLFSTENQTYETDFNVRGFLRIN